MGKHGKNYGNIRNNLQRLYFFEGILRCFVLGLKFLFVVLIVLHFCHLFILFVAGFRLLFWSSILFGSCFAMVSVDPTSGLKNL